MCKALVRAVVGLAIVGACGAPAAAQVPTSDSVTGTLSDASVGISVNVEAISGPAGENATGTLGWNESLRAFASGEVTCLAVQGNTAVVGFTGMFTVGVDTVPIAGLARFVDAGGPASATDSFEWALVRGEPFGEPIPGPTDCSSYPATFTPSGVAFNRDFGDIVVTDGRATPVSKEQCKHGGWRQYAVFKNQGDCVSFVASRGKNPPAGP